MKTYSRKVAPDLTSQLEAAGVLTADAQDGTGIHPAPPGLLISQVGGYALPLHVAVDLPEFRILGWELDLPWEDTQFQLLADPREYMSKDDMYQIPSYPRLRYPRDEVLNHRRVLQRGHALDGQLLAYSFESIPDSYRHGATIDASLVLIDEMSRGFSTRVQLWVNRSAKIDQRRRKKSTRPGLFEKRDVVKGQLVQK
jgi:hypothetical protein